MRQIDNMSAEEIETLKLKGMLPDKLAVTNATVDYYERRELDHIREFRNMKSQRDEALTQLEASQAALSDVMSELTECRKEHAILFRRLTKKRL